MIEATEGEFAELLKAIEAQEQARAAHMPTEADALQVLQSAYQHLRALGWRDIDYCPKDGTVFDSISVGSTGIHPCHYEGKWPDGRWWVLDGGDSWPARPILYRPRQEAQAGQ